MNQRIDENDSEKIFEFPQENREKISSREKIENKIKLFVVNLLDESCQLYPFSHSLFEYFRLSPINETIVIKFHSIFYLSPSQCDIVVRRENKKRKK